MVEKFNALGNLPSYKPSQWRYLYIDSHTWDRLDKLDVFQIAACLHVWVTCSNLMDFGGNRPLYDLVRSYKSVHKVSQYLLGLLLM